MVSSTVSRIDQKILNEFIRCGAFERHLNRMRKIYKGKHDVLMESLKGFRKKFTIRGDHAGSHILLCAKYEVTEEWLRMRAEENGIKVLNPGSLTYPRQEGRKYTYIIMDIDENGEVECTLHHLEN